MRNGDWKYRNRGLIAGCLAATLFIGGMTTAATSYAAGPDFTGKKILFWTAHRGADSVLSLKTWTNYISKYLPGNPTITVQSKFGGGGLTNANFFAATAKPDGLTASMINLPAILRFALKRKGVKFDPTKLVVAGAESSVYVHLAGTSAEVGDGKDLKKAGRQHTFGTRSRNFNVMTAELLWRAAGNPVRVVTGFRGTETVIQALGSGELMLGYAYIAAWLRNKDSYRSLGLKPVYQLGVLDDSGNVVRAPAISDIPTAAELYDSLNSGGSDSSERKALQTATGMYQIGKTFFLQQGTSRAISEAWQTAMDKAANDPKFIAEHKKLFGIPLAYVPAKAANTILKASLDDLGTPFFQKGGPGYKMIVGQRRKKRK